MRVGYRVNSFMRKKNKLKITVATICFKNFTLKAIGKIGFHEPHYKVPCLFDANDSDKRGV